MTYNIRKIRQIIIDGGRSVPAGLFAVLMPFVMDGGEICLLFETRAMNMRRQPGEVCFPGGKIEAGESPERCAARECFEETGIPLSQIRIIGSMGSMKSLLNEDVNVVAGEITDFDRESLNINPAEVHNIFTVPLSWLLERGPQTAFNYEGHYIWGLTARAVNMMIKLVQSSEI